VKISECNDPISGNIERIISENGMKQSHVAEKLNLTRSAFNAMLKGRKLIKPCDVNNIASALDVPVSELFSKK
jgi:transcriptional regulator with XRE-family HTH domain